VHGEEEARLVLVDSFHNENERGEMRNLRGEGEVEDPLPWMFQQHNPEFNPPFSQFNRVSFCRMLTVPCWIRKGWWIPPWRGEIQPMTPLTQRLSKRRLQQQLLPLATASCEIAVLYARVAHGIGREQRW